MPASIIEKVAKHTDLTYSEADELWEKAKNIAKNQNHPEEYAYIMGIFKKSLGKERLNKLEWESTGNVISTIVHHVIFKY